MQFTEVFSQWLVSLGHIFKVKTGDMDMLGVVLQRRILVVILPSLENSDKTNAGLGKIVVAMLRSMMALTRGSKLEGDYGEIVGNRPSEAFAPFKVVFDELAYYVTAGMDGMLAQGRGLGLHFLLGFQEAAGLLARIGERMWSLLGNANLQIIMRLQDGNQTRTYVEKTAGEAHVTRNTSYSSASDLFDAHVASDHAEVRQVSRVNWLDVRALRPGQAIVLFQNSRVYTQVFYAPVKLAGVIRRNKPSMLDRPEAADLRRHFARTAGPRSGPCARRRGAGGPHAALRSGSSPDRRRSPDRHAAAWKPLERQRADRAAGEQAADEPAHPFRNHDSVGQGASAHVGTRDNQPCDGAIAAGRRTAGRAEDQVSLAFGLS